MKEIWYGFNKNGQVVEKFYGTFSEAAGYFSSEESNTNVQYFDRRNDID